MVKETLRKIGKRMLDDTRGAMDAVSIAVTVVVLVVVASIGVFIADKIYDVAQVDSGSVFYNASTQVPTIMNTSYSLLLILVISVIAGVIIAYLMGGFARRR